MATFVRRPTDPLHPPLPDFIPWTSLLSKHGSWVSKSVLDLVVSLTIRALAEDSGLVEDEGRMVFRSTLVVWLFWIASL